MKRLLTVAAVAATLLTVGGSVSALSSKEPATKAPVAKKVAVVESPAAIEPVVTEAAPVAPEPKTVTVARGDYLSRLAAANSTTYLRLFYANTEIANPDLIFPGQVLSVPAEDEALVARALPETAPVEVKQQVAANPAADTQPVAPAPTRAPAPRQVTAPAAPAVANGSVWDRLAMCEATGNWAINTGNGYYGGLQFTLSSWRAVGGTGYPHEASREEQISRGIKLQALQGWGAWPACTAKLGIR